ncbi:MAG: hypothetical protein KGM43_19260 [Planctomycetota bacterium]|nr:hypothetical protein [Planctomycetota bacterium]
MDQHKDQIVGMVMLLGGVFTVAGALSNWSWYWNSRRARALTRLIGVPAARVLYLVLGLVLSSVGVALGLGFGGKG